MTATSYRENFRIPNWCKYNNSMGGSWPPGVGTNGHQVPGMWSRCLFNGWPTNTGSQDSSARNQAGSNDAQCYEDGRAAVSPYGLVLTAENEPGVEFPQFPDQSGMVCSNPNYAFGFGLFQAQVYLPAGTGLDRAMVLYNADIFKGWESEYDCPEFVGKDKNNNASNTAVRFGAHASNNSQNSGLWAELPYAAPNLFNVACLLNANGMQCYINEKLVGTLPCYPATIADPNLIVVFGMATGNANSWEGPFTQGTATMMVKEFAWDADGSWGKTMPWISLPAVGK